MNDFSRALEFLLEREQNLFGAVLALAETPSGPIGMESPRRATVALFASPTLHCRGPQLQSSQLPPLTIQIPPLKQRAASVGHTQLVV